MMDIKPERKRSALCFVFSFVLSVLLLATACSSVPQKPDVFIDVPLQSSAPITESRKAIIVCRKAYQEAAHAFAYLNREFEGVATMILYVEDMLSLRNTGYKRPPFRGYADDDPHLRSEKLKILEYDYILARAISWNLRQIAREQEPLSVMIIGDAKVVPPSYYFYIPYTNRMKIGGQEIVYNDWIPSDIFYGNRSDRLRYGWATGRISVVSPREAMFIAEKYYAWYRSAPDLKTNTFIYAGGNMFNDARYFGEMLQLELQERYGVVQAEDTYLESQDRFSKTKVHRSFKSEHAAIVLIISHGNGDGFGLSDGWLNSEDIYKAGFKPGLPLVVTPACMDGSFDTRLVDYPNDRDGMSVGEAVLRSAGAGIGYLGGTRIDVVNDLFRIEDGRVRDVRFGFAASLVTDIIGQYLRGKTRIADVFIAATDSFTSHNDLNNLGMEASLIDLCLMGNPVMSLPSPPRLSRPDVAADLSITQNERYGKKFETKVDGIPGMLPLFEKRRSITIRPKKSVASIDVIDTGKKKTIIQSARATQTEPVRFSPKSSGFYLIRSRYLDGTRTWHYLLVK